MNLQIFQIDAFTDNVFAGNPAAVCPLNEWLPDDQMQKIALENNLSETAFFVDTGDAFGLRWFTPAEEVDLCGHATLATAYLLLTRLTPEKARVDFDTRSGRLSVTRDGDFLAMDFPAQPPRRMDTPQAIADALGGSPREFWAQRDFMAVYETEAEVRVLKPDMAGLMDIDGRGVIATAPGEECDFVSRFFAPAVGIPEDPVTGSTHCVLVPYWSERLGKADLTARQVSPRGGELFCRNEGNRVRIAGRAALYMVGEIFV
ncbi:MAG: PhzF family phenazine biosynthesis protein [Rhodospirillales bacterium]|jgi:PhzF family phenazine biosynthesis protein|nr:PhzF family phenazine biosynthesis protein [Rhodospirillales bacterium]